MALGPGEQEADLCSTEGVGRGSEPRQLRPGPSPTPLPTPQTRRARTRHTHGTRTRHTHGTHTRHTHSTCTRRTAHVYHTVTCAHHTRHTQHTDHMHTPHSIRHTHHGQQTHTSHITRTRRTRLTHASRTLTCTPFALGLTRGPQTHLRVPTLLLCYRRPPEASGSKGAAWPQAPLRLCTRCSPGPPSPRPSLQLCGGAPPPPPAVPAPASPAPSAWGGLLPLTSSAGAGGGALLQAPHCHARPLSFQPS